MLSEWQLQYDCSRIWFTCAHLFWRSSLSWRSWPSSERRLRSWLLREESWLRSSDSNCLLAWRSAFRRFTSCSSLFRKGKKKKRLLYEILKKHPWEITGEHRRGKYLAVCVCLTLQERLACPAGCWGCSSPPGPSGPFLHPSASFHSYRL